MGTTHGPYIAEFPVGTRVRIVDRDRLEAFMRDWRWHDPVEPEALQFAGRATEVVTVDFYHGGDDLYSLKGIPGLWHESCLVAME